MNEPLKLPPPGCRRCVDSRGRGWLPFVIVTINGIECARRCTCARGRWFAALDSLRGPRRASEPAMAGAVEIRDGAVPVSKSSGAKAAGLSAGDQ